MSGNTFGRLFTVTSFGESHGPALGCIVDGCPPGLELTETDLQADVDRRRTGTSKFVSQRREPDAVRILSGVFEGRTTGAPIGLLIENTDARSRDYEKIKDRFRPGPCRLHLPAKVRFSRLSRRWPLLGARNRDAGGRRRHRPQIPGPAPGRAHLWLRQPDRSADALSRSTRRPHTKIRSSVRIRRASRSWRRCCGRCAAPGIPSARKSRSSPAACRRA